MSVAAFIDEDADRRGLFVMLLVAALAGLVLLLYWDSFVSMARIWQFSNYRHGAVVFPVSAFLLWRLRSPLSKIELRPCAWGIFLLLGLVLLWLVGRAVGVQVAEQSAAVLLIPATILVFLGFRLARRAMFPLLFLVAAVPIGDALIPHLMQVTADLSTALLRASGVPVYRQGQFLSLPGGNFEVADVCAGLSYLTAGTIIALLFSYFTYQSNVKRLAFVAGAAVVMVLANGLRAFIVMFVASGTDMRYLAGRDHVYFGWVLFGIVVVGLLYVGGRFAEDSREDVRSRHGDAARSGALQADGFSGNGAYRGFGNVLMLFVAVAALAAGPFLLTSRASAERLAPRIVDLPAIDACGAPSGWSADWLPEFQSPDAILSGEYRCSGEPVSVFVASYLDNAQGRELITKDNRLIPDDWQRFVLAREHRFTSKDGRTIRVNEMQVELPGAPSLVWYWYEAGGAAATTSAVVKIRQALQLLMRGRADGSAFLFQTPLGESLEASRRRLALVAGEVERLELTGPAGDPS